MRQISHFFRNLIVRMVRALLIWGVVIGGISVGVVFLTSRHAPNISEWILIAIATSIGGLLGMMSALAWELTHIPHFIRLARRQTRHDKMAELPAASEHQREPVR